MQTQAEGKTKTWYYRESNYGCTCTSGNGKMIPGMNEHLAYALDVRRIQKNIPGTRDWEYT